jgi:hypothetical protein
MKNNYLLQLSQENYVLKQTCNELQNELQKLKEKQEKLYLTLANTVLILHKKNVKNQDAFRRIRSLSS